MATFSISEAAFAGFRIIRDKPLSLVFWVLAQLVFAGITFGLFLLVAAPIITDLISQLRAGAAQDPAESMRIFRTIAPLDLLMLPLSLIYYAVLYGAINRAILRPKESAFGYLRLGADELRQAGVLVLIWLIMLAVYIASLILSFIGAFTTAMVFGRSPLGGFLAALVSRFLLLAPLIYVGTKLSLASPQTFATRRFNLFGSWTLTRGRFWPVFGVYFISFLILFIIGLVLFLVIGSAVFGLGIAAQFTSAMRSNNLAGAAIIPFILGYILILNLYFLVILPVWLAPPAAIYRSLTAGTETKEIEAVFS